MAFVRQSVRFLLAGLLLFFLISPFVQTQTSLKSAAFSVQWQRFVTSFGMLLLYRSFYTFPFATFLSVITQKHVPFRNAFTLFHLANITRYLPGRIWGVVRLLSLSHRFGLSKTAVGSSLTLHVGIETALGGLISLSILFSPKIRESALGILEKFSGHTLLLTLGVAGIFTGLLLGIPKLAHHARGFLKTLVPLLKNAQLWVNALTVHSLLWCCQGLAFFLFVRSFVPLQWIDAGGLVACFAFAWIVGFLSFLTPGGLGIREGLLGLLLSNYMLHAQATLVVLLCRLWMLSAEILLAVTSFFLQREHT
ncbi:hypothetical protein C6496_10990 [Candidatus Poribacteria bacterium]|nr:MAG: hypothetical protein C6496_10990 [Candidatus Poribacteria bacterium]